MSLVHVSGTSTTQAKGGRKATIFNSVKTPDYKREVFNFDSMTDGELHLQLKGAQFRLLHATHPNHKLAEQWKEAENMYMNAVYNGVHGISANTTVTGYLTSNLMDVQRDIISTRGRFSPAGTAINLIGRSNVGVGTDPLIQYTDYAECEKFKKFDITAFNLCQNRIANDKDLRWKKVFNEHLERGSHHVLYEFMDDKQAASVRPTQQWKNGEHQKALSVMSNISALSRVNIVEWHRLGVMRHNALKGGVALPPESTIAELFKDPNATFENILKEYKDPETGKDVSVGFIPAAAWIIFACAAALAGIAGVIQAINKQEPTALDRIAGIGSVLFSPQGNDISLPKGDTGNDINTGNGNQNNNTGNNNNGGDNTKKPTFFEENKDAIIMGGVALTAATAFYLATKD
jgi:hypothetical protein